MHKRPSKTLLCAMIAAIGLAVGLWINAGLSLDKQTVVYAVGYATDMANFGPKSK